MLLVLAAVPDADIAVMESGAARTGGLVLAVAGGQQHALVHASSLTLERSADWVRAWATIVGVRSVLPN
jgi:hypothetical protein